MKNILYNILNSNPNKILEQIYHKGQKKSWDGKTLLRELLRKYGTLNADTEKSKALNELLNVILWGELAAWQTSILLSFELNNIDAKMAATSQAHDEARHFYVMREYLKENSYTPVNLNPATKELLDSILGTKCIAKRLLGMQLMVEPVAITMFKFIRDIDIDPVLTELLLYYERDEARHIALGVQYLPTIIKNMSWHRKVGLLAFQYKLLLLELESLKHLKKSYACLDIDFNKVFELAEKKQLDALILLAQELNIPQKVWEPILKAIRFQKSVVFSENHKINSVYRLSALLRKFILGF